MVELNSVRNPLLPALYVPASVFPSVEPVFYWTATTSATDSTFAWFVNFSNGNVDTLVKSNGGGGVWCVRGPMNADAY
jgi:hypothetical protein